MVQAGLVTVGRLLRERRAARTVALVGLAADRGTVLAAGAWAAPEAVLPLPEARDGSHEALLHATVDHPERESGNYVPTRMGGRYDALPWFEGTTALHPLHHEAPPTVPELETEPTDS